MFVSQCSGRALKETRRILDQFAERKGECVWQTNITQQGLLTLKKLLRQTARRNTAVICHWIKKANYSEVLWMVGNVKKFNEVGAVPTNTTHRNIRKAESENTWHTGQVISTLAAIAGLFHDVGKANALFQEKLQKLRGNKKTMEPYRHEWISLCIFQAFVAEKSDKEWLHTLSHLMPADEVILLERLKQYRKNGLLNHPFSHFSTSSSQHVAKIVAWLIVSHHRLPVSTDSHPRVEHIDQWANFFNSSWNSPQSVKDHFDDDEKNNVWYFPKGTPFASKTWCEKANRLAVSALKQEKLFLTDWLYESFSSHLARLSLMLADHCYSSGEADPKLQDRNYHAYANTDKKGVVKQKLDEHNIGVARDAENIARKLPDLRSGLPRLANIKSLKKRTSHKKFLWQNKAYELTYSVRERTERQGFFGINMASTGSGKTFANARIMYGLANEKQGCRFSVALGLRTLTLQTGDMFRERLHLAVDDLAVLIGSQAVTKLHHFNKTNSEDVVDEKSFFTGSESTEDFLEETQHVHYEGNLDGSLLSRWLNRSGKLNKLLSAPVLVSTVDHLIAATEGVRGGKQIAPMLRLLTSDLVLDEPDDFGLEDLPALTRLVNWAGMLGSRVLLSSATLPPALVEALFVAYLDGRKKYNEACGECRVANDENKVCCAWFDELSSPQQGDYHSGDAFLLAHNEFVDQRIEKLKKAPAVQQAKLLTISSDAASEIGVIKAYAELISQQIPVLHNNHHVLHPASGKRVSVGVVRMANIKQLVAVAKNIISISPPEDTRIHFCVYHSRYPLILRAEIERMLDRTLKRYSEAEFWKIDWVASALKQVEKNQIFLVLASPVAEVGRDHDYDWAIVEPSSMRSLIQLAGRVQRHRQTICESPNVFVLNKNIKALEGKSVAYFHPGFELNKDKINFTLESKDLHDVLTPDQYSHITATPRIKAGPISQLKPRQNFVDLEQAHLHARLFGGQGYATYASLWWQQHVNWSAELQRRTPFRLSFPEEPVFLYPYDGEDLEWSYYPDSPKRVESGLIEEVSLSMADRVQPWLSAFNIDALLANIAESENLELSQAARIFSEFTLPDVDSPSSWEYNPLLGVYSPVAG